MAALDQASLAKITSLSGIFMCFLGCTGLHCLPFHLEVYSQHNIGKLEAMGQIS
jgi:hypothetical protein